MAEEKRGFGCGVWLGALLGMGGAVAVIGLVLAALVVGGAGVWFYMQVGAPGTALVVQEDIPLAAAEPSEATPEPDVAPTEEVPATGTPTGTAAPTAGTDGAATEEPAPAPAPQPGPAPAPAAAPAPGAAPAAPKPAPAAPAPAAPKPAPTGPTSVPPDIIATMLNNNMGIKKCYVPVFKATGAMPGKVDVKFTIAPSGAVTSASVTNPTTIGPEFNACMSAAIKAIGFPPFNGTAAQNATHTFAAG